MSTPIKKERVKKEANPTEIPKVKRGVRKKPTIEEQKIILAEELEDIRKHIEELKAEESRFGSQASAFTKIAELVKDELEELAGEQEEIQVEYDALMKSSLIN